MNVLFDLDGTLTDPGEGFVASVKHALAKLGCPERPDAEIRRHVGPPLQDTLTLLLGGRASVEQAVGFYRERYARQGFLENSVYAGVEDALESLAAQGHALFVATSKPLLFAERILRHFRLHDFFRGVYGSELDGGLSHKTPLIAHVLRAESLAPTSTVMVGDRAQDMAGALANAVHPIGALWGYGSRQELADAGARVLCEHPAELPACLTGARA